MAGKPDPEYVKARRVLLDALVSLTPHAGALVVVGAQAVYLHVGEAGLAVAPFTTDGDLAIRPTELADAPLLETALRGSGFTPTDQPGIWTRDDVELDLLVPEAVGGDGRRGARLGPHGNRAARKVRGLEGALVDFGVMELPGLEDDRRLASPLRMPQLKGVDRRLPITVPLSRGASRPCATRSRALRVGLVAAASPDHSRGASSWTTDSAGTRIPAQPAADFVWNG